MTVDTTKKKAILNKYIVQAIKHQFMTKFSLPKGRSLQIAKLDKIVNIAADLNNITPEHTKKIDLR